MRRQAIVNIGSLLRWEKEFSRAVLRLSVPVSIQSLIVALMHIVDNLMISELGESYLAGVSQANRITFLMQMTMFGLVSGASVFTAQFWGAKDIKGIHETLGIGMLTGILGALVFAIPSVLIPGKLIRLLLHEEPAIRAGVSYLRIVGLAYGVQAVSLTQSSVLRSTEQVKLPMVASIAAILTNLLFNYLLIYGKFGFPRLEAAGAALATLLGACLELAILLIVGYGKKLPNAAPLRALRFTRARAVAYFKVVLPTTLNECLWGLGMVLYSVAYGLMGAGTVAAISIYDNIHQLASVVLRGATNACAVMVGMQVGAGHGDEAQKTAGRMLAGGAVIGVVIGTLVMLSSSFLVSWFNVSPETAKSARNLVNMYGLTMFLPTMATIVIVGILRAGGDVRFAMFNDILPVWLVGLPLVFLSGPLAGWPIQYVFLLTRIEELVKTANGIRRIASRRWIRRLV